ncbi:hypothetical protein O181_042874 [Austropuccinia psidii MF-1]|uniref:Uncharacterized protein n=1 Tax=Austropuccinia psidii MF-1 TaxID=1389203 RepID=A0A9Q3DH85_9BASI|nr:hypothetical protein [Austropuccinia psidii MF-1]
MSSSSSPQQRREDQASRNQSTHQIILKPNLNPSSDLHLHHHQLIYRPAMMNFNRQDARNHLRQLLGHWDRSKPSISQSLQSKASHPHRRQNNHTQKLKNQFQNEHRQSKTSALTNSNCTLIKKTKLRNVLKANCYNFIKLLSKTMYNVR